MYGEIKAKIEKRLAQNSQNREHVTLIAVSKTRSAGEICIMFDQGVRHFGENYVQEALEKKAQLTADVAKTIVWHLIGPLQSNKAKLVAGEFDWVQSVASEKLAKMLNRHRPEAMGPLNLCIQVNIDDAQTKNGIKPNVEHILKFIGLICELPRVVIRGLMVMPDAGSVERTQAQFSAAKVLFDQTFQRLHVESPEIAENFDTLSMGMSSDYAIAIDAGSTMVRIGTALFGPRC